MKGRDISNMTDKRICIGEITTAHGIRGQVRVRCFGDNPDSLHKYGPLYTSETGTETVTITLQSPNKGAWVARVKTKNGVVDDRNVAETMRGTMLWIDRSALPNIESDDEFYHTDLIGMDVADENGNAIGTVADVQNFGASDLLEIKPTEGGPTFYVPFADDFIHDVDMDARRIIVEMVEGLRGDK